MVCSTKIKFIANHYLFQIIEQIVHNVNTRKYYFNPHLMSNHHVNQILNQIFKALMNSIILSLVLLPYGKETSYLQVGVARTLFLGSSQPVR